MFFFVDYSPKKSISRLKSPILNLSFLNKIKNILWEFKYDRELAIGAENEWDIWRHACRQIGAGKHYGKKKINTPNFFSNHPTQVKKCADIYSRTLIFNLEILSFFLFRFVVVSQEKNILTHKA